MNKFLLFVILLLFSDTLFSQNIPEQGKESRLEIANWNLNWFGKTVAGFGPADDTLQQQLVLSSIKNSGVDIWILQEVCNKKAMVKLMAELPEYSFVLSDAFPEQKTAVIYKNSMFGLIEYRSLGTDAPDSFSTHRFPLETVLVPKFNTAIDTLFIIALHLKSNIGNDSEKLAAYYSRKRSSEWIKMYLDRRMKHRYCMVSGDWNDDIDRSVYMGIPSPFANLLNRAAGFSFITGKLSEEGISTSTSYPETIDHQLVSGQLSDLFCPDSVIVWRLDNYIPSYSDLCSDHYPVLSYFRQSMISDIKPIHAHPRLSVFPNPFSDDLQISGVQDIEIISILLYDQKGKAFELEKSKELKYHLPATVRKGIYYLRIETLQRTFYLMCIHE